MTKETQKKAAKKYKSTKAQIQITVDQEIKALLDEAAARNGKSKAQYIVDLIKADNKII